MSAEIAKAQPVVGLDIIRFSAAAAVMWFHLAYSTWAARSTPYRFVDGLYADAGFGQYATWGWVGVEIFFVLSGFVISFSARGKQPGDFARGRLLRLYPAAFVCSGLIVAIAVALYFSGAGPFAATDIPMLFVRSVLLWPVAPWLDSVFWTLGVEMAFYATIFALLRFASFSKLPLLLCVIGLASSGALFANELGAEIPIRARWAELILLPHGCFFAIGGLLWVHSTRGLRPLEWVMFSVFVAAGLVEIWTWSDHLDVPGLGPMLVWLLATLAVYSAVRWNDKVTSHLPAGAPAIARTIGMATYPLYMIHNTVGAASMQTVLRNGGSNGLALTAGILTSLIAALLIAVLAEPVTRSAFSKAMSMLSFSSRPRRQHPSAPN